MKTSSKIGVLVILSGVAVLGYAWFKKNKPTVAKTQAEKLQELSNYYESGVGANEETYIKGTSYVAPKVEGISLAQVDYTNLTNKQIEDIKSSIGTVTDTMTLVTNQIGQNLENKDFGNQYMNWSGLTFNNIKIA